MKYKLKKSEILDILKKSINDGKRIVAPSMKNNMINFHVIKDINDIAWDAYTKISAKEFIFPRFEPIFAFEKKENTLKIFDVKPNTQVETIIFGLRPCDAAGFSILDHVFKWDYDDKFYWERRNATTLISLSCLNPTQECFCLSVGLSPTSEKGSDILITQNSQDDFLLEVLTDKGKKFIGSTCNGKETELDKTEITKKAESNIKRKENFKGISKTLKEKFNKDELWKNLTQACIGCGACAMVCPTCHCFDIVDEGDYRGGVRLKNWDVCSLSLFTKHGGGHNPRNTQYKRCRQRYLHKFSYYQEKFGENLCVGCGRCIKVCPVCIDIYSIMEVVKRAEL